MVVVKYFLTNEGRNKKLMKNIITSSKKFLNFSSRNRVEGFETFFSKNADSNFNKISILYFDFRKLQVKNFLIG